MEPTTIVFIAACIGAMACCNAAKDDAGGAIALAMLGTCGAYTLAWHGSAPSFFPLFDLPVAIAAYVLWFDDDGEWRTPFLIIFSARFPLHILGAWQGMEHQVGYYHALNATFMAALAALSSGGIHDLADSCIRRFRELCGKLAPHRASGLSQAG